MAKWKTVKLGDVCNVERGGSPRPIDNFITEDDGGVNWIKIGLHPMIVCIYVKQNKKLP